MTVKLLMPWEEHVITFSHHPIMGTMNFPVRKNISGKIIANIGFNLDGSCFSNITHAYYKNEKIAKEETDKKLLVDGYMLLTKEQANKYKILI